MRRFLSLFTAFSLTAIMAFGQQREITGRVVDESGKPVPGASVIIAGTNQGTAADENGYFRLNVPANARLTVSSVGLNATTVSVGNQTSLNVSLGRSALGPDNNVVVTSLGISRQKEKLGYATASVKAQELTQAKATNLQNGLTGKVSGLNVATTNSGVRGETRMTLRGIRSLTGNNQPMLIVDGTPTALSFLSSINPNDIASVDILKSNTATAVYGPEGTNGAIVVSTKRGSSLKPTVSVGHSVQFETINYMPQFQTEWGSGYDQDPNTGEGKYIAYEQQSWGDRFDGTIRPFGEADPNGVTRELKYSYYPNARKKFWETGMTNQTDVSFSAAGFYLGAQNVDVKGILKGDRNQRRSVSMRAEKEINKFRAVFDVRYTNSKYNVATANQQVYYGVTSAPGQVPLFQYSDWRNDYWSSPDGYYTTYLTNFFFTPAFARDNFRLDGNKNDIFGNLELNYRLVKGVNFTYRLGYAQTNELSKSTAGPLRHSAFYLTRPSGPSNKILNSSITENSYNYRRLTSEAFANLNKGFGKVEMNAVLGYSYRNSKIKSLSLGSSNLGTNEFISIVNRLGEPSVSDASSDYISQRAFGILGFSFNRWFNVEGTASYDQDSRLVPAVGAWSMKDISFFYPGVSASIVMHELVPSISNTGLSVFKIRGAYAKTGNVNIEPYRNAQTFGTGTFFPYGTTQGFLIGSNVYANKIKPEFVNTLEGGIELGYKGRVALEASYYHQKNTDQIIDIQLSNTTGASVATLNAADFTNKGFEVDLRLTPLFKLGAFNFDFKANYSHQDNVVNTLLAGTDTKELGIGNYNFAIVNQPAYVFKFTDYVRDSASGKVIVDPVSGMPSVNSTESVFGRTLPKHILGLSTNISWKNFNLGIVAEYRGGNFIVADQLGQFMDDNGISARSGYYGRRAFIFPNSVYMSGGKYVDNNDVYTSNYGRLFFNADVNTSAISNYYADGAFWKLREVSLTYTIPQDFFGGKFIKGGSIGFSGRNLLMWLPKSNMWTDPEFQGGNGNSAYTGNAVGRTTAYNMPPTRFMGANITLNF